MKHIETTATITKDGQLTAPAPPGVPPGKRKIVLVMGDEPQEKAQKRKLVPPVTKLGRAAPGATFSREEIYGEDGR